MIQVTITPRGQGTKRARKILAELERKIKNPMKANHQVSIWLMRWVNENFRTEGRKVGGWAPFKYGGRVKGGKIDTSAKLLQDTGRLKGSFYPFWSRVNAGVGSALPYAELHEFGTAHVPARRMVPEQSDREVTDKVIKIYEWHIMRQGK